MEINTNQNKYTFEILFNNTIFYWNIEKTNFIQRLLLRLVGIKIKRKRR